MKQIDEIVDSFYNFNGSDLKKLRKKLYLSQQKMAELLGYESRSYICHFEKTERRLPKHLALLCNLIKNNFSNDV
jgi:transcriptional regulator with XRE-family HTH domain